MNLLFLIIIIIKIYKKNNKNLVDYYCKPLHNIIIKVLSLHFDAYSIKISKRYDLLLVFSLFEYVRLIFFNILYYDHPPD